MNGKNRYTCDTCNGSIVTEDRDEGTTPFMLGCRAKTGCKGMMRSSFYRGVAPDEPVDFIWRKPTSTEVMRASKAMLQHFAMGGLDIYPNAVNAQGATPTNDVNEENN